MFYHKNKYPFWGATVITNLFSAVPYVGTRILEGEWGGFSVNNATLRPFFSLHFTFPFVIICLVFLHEKKIKKSFKMENILDKVFWPLFFNQRSKKIGSCLIFYFS